MQLLLQDRQMMKNDYLKIIFFKRLSNYTHNARIVSETFDELLRRYDADNRHYHDIRHIANLLNLLDNYKFLIADYDVLYFAIWFHDAIYDAWQSNNEKKSADWATEVLKQTNFDPSRIEKVAQYINATKTHTSNGESDLNFFLDFDLSILGAEETIYDVYTRQIREEFHLVPSFIYNRGRRKILRGFLDREAIYKTDAFRYQIEPKARENMQRELENL